MVKYLVASLSFIIFSLLSAHAQELEIGLDSLAKIGDIMVNDSLQERRIAANEIIKRALSNRLQNPETRFESLDQVKAIAVRPSRDDKFRIISWQLFLTPDEYRHNAIIQFMDGKRKPIVLEDQSHNIIRPDRKQLNANNWFGAIYYNIIPFKLKGKTQYLLFGFDGATSTENCKILDVLSFDKKGNAIFGSPIFQTERNGIEQISLRFFHQYDQNAKAVLNYDPEQEIIIYDHLIPWTSKEYGVGLTYVPDGSYEGFELKKGKWRHIEKVFSHVSAVPISAENPLGRKQKAPKNQ